MRKSSRRGFTLVELLVVIGIIAVLISILLPALNKARQQANEVKCESNMKQIFTCVAMYVAENKNYMPYPNWQGDVTQPGNGTQQNGQPAGTYSVGWLFNSDQQAHTTITPGESWSRVAPPADGMKTGALWAYNKSIPIYHCPLYNPDSTYGTEFMTSYLMNGAVCSYGWRSPIGPHVHPAHHITKFLHPAEKCLMWEAEENFVGNGSQWNDGSSYPSEEHVTSRHYKGANILFFDGHVEWWFPQQFDQLAQAPTSAGPNALWCNPTSTDGH